MKKLKEEVNELKKEKSYLDLQIEREQKELEKLKEVSFELKVRLIVLKELLKK